LGKKLSITGEYHGKTEDVNSTPSSSLLPEKSQATNPESPLYSA
jgi:hypothetical protein